METKNMGTVRGGPNQTARLHIHIDAGDLTPAEYEALFRVWDEEFAIKGMQWLGWWYGINSRREFAALPAILRKAERLGYRVATSMWDVGVKGKIFLQDDPAEFWRVCAMAQTFFEVKN